MTRRLDVMQYYLDDDAPAEAWNGSLAGDTRDGYRITRMMPGFRIERKGAIVCHVAGWRDVFKALKIDREYRALFGEEAA